MKTFGRPKYEVVIVTMVVIITIIISIGIYSERSKVNKRKLLITEMDTLRSNIALYIIHNKSKPPSLDALSLPKIDPFGNEYTYDPETGRVSSITEGYESW
jgi:competence protein ComGC